MSTSRTALLGILTLVVACEQPPVPKADDAGVADGGAKAPGMEQLGDVAKQLGATDLSPEELAKQPPVGGIFAPGVADRAHAPGAAPSLSMIGEGDEPRIALHAAAFEPGQILGMQLDVKIQGQSLPGHPHIVMLEVAPPTTDPAKDTPKDPKAPKAPAPSGSASASASAAPAVPEPPPGADRPLTVMVTGLSPQGQPDDFRAVLLFTMTKSGPTDFKRKLMGGDASTTNPEKAMVHDLELSAIEELLTALYTPAPPQPVGEKAMWMVTDRRSSFGSDVVRYRAFTVTKVDGDHAVLSLDIRQYAANGDSALVPEEFTMGSYNSLGKGQLDVAPRLHFPKSGRVKVVVSSQMVPVKMKDTPNAPGKPLSFEVQAQIGELQLQKPDGTPAGKPGEQPPGKPEKPKKPAGDPGKKPPAPAPPAPPPP
jgi:hypothetical protein